MPRSSSAAILSESLRNDGRIWVPKRAEDCDKDPRDIPEEDRDYYLERIYPSFGNLVPRDIASRQAKNMCDEGRGVGPKIDGVARGVYLDFSDAIQRMGKAAVSAKYGNLFDMYKQITDDDPYEVPMRIYPAVHYTMGGLWVDYDLQSSIPGLYVTGEANFSDHGANRMIVESLAEKIVELGIEKVWIRTPMDCKSKQGRAGAHGQSLLRLHSRHPHPPARLAWRATKPGDCP